MQRFLALGLAVPLSLQVVSASPVAAQGLLQQLFGLSPSPQARSVPRPLPPREPVGQSTPSWIIPGSPGTSRSAGKAAPEGSGSYTTVCVRMCDGYHFPISHRVPRSRFHRDADMCRTRCGASEARLFYHASGSSMQHAVDLTGRSYARLPMAFAHRKQLVDGCACRPEPWSIEAQIRHEGYAIAEGRPVPVTVWRPAGTLSIVAGSYPDAPPYVSSAQDDSNLPREQVAAADADAASIDDQATADAQSGEARPSSPQGDTAHPAGRKPAHAAHTARPGQSRTPRGIRTAAPVTPAPKPARVAAAAPRLVWPGDAPVRTR